MAIITQSRNLTDYVATSTSAFTASPGTKSIVITTGKAFYVGQALTLAAVGSKLPTRLRVTVTSHDPVTGAMVVDDAVQRYEPDTPSYTSLTISTGAKTLTTLSGLGLIAGDGIRFCSAGAAARSMVGTVTTYDNATGALTVNITGAGSSGTYADWFIVSDGAYNNWVVTYGQADIMEKRNGAILTITETPPTRFGTAQCITSGGLEVINNNPTVPLILDLHDMNHDFRYEAGGVLKFRGAPMSLGTGDGTQKTWDFTSLFGGQIRHNTYVEVEESVGNGRYMPWSIIPEDPKFNVNCGLNATIGGGTPSDFTAANTAAGRVLFWNETNRTLRCGDGTNGGVIPNGCAVRIPNIFVSNRLLTNQTTVFNIICLGGPTGGSINVEISRENGFVMGVATIPFNATSAQVDTLIEAVTGVGTVTTGSGPLPAAVSVTWAGAYANERLGVRISANNLTGGSNPQAFVYENNAANCSLIDLNPLGTFDAEWVSFSDKILFSVESFKSIRTVSCGYGNAGVRFINSNGSVEIDGFNCTRSPYVSQGTVDITSVFGDVSLERIVTASKLSSFNPQNLPNLKKFDRVTTIFYGQRNSTSNRAVGLSALPAGTLITNFATIGAAPNFANMNEVKIVNWSYADGTLAAQNTAQAQSAAFLQNCSNITLAGYYDAGPMSLRNYLLSTDTFSKGIKVLGAESANASNGVGGLLMQCSGVEVSNAKFSDIRTSASLVDMPGNYLANNLSLKKIFYTFGTGTPITTGLDACQGGVYDLVSATPQWITETFAGVNEFVGGNYANTSLTPTTGFVGFGPFGAGVGLELTGTAYTDALGAFLLPEAGDSATITMPFAMHAITALTNSNPLLYADVPGAAANQHVLAAPGGPTGGTYFFTVKDASGTLLGTSSVLTVAATGVNIANAIQSIAGIGAGNVSCSNSLTAGGIITFQGALAGQSFIVEIDGSALTGGTEPGVAYVAGRARLMTGTETFGANITAEFAVRVPGTSWPSWQAITGANLAAAIPALTGYQPGGSGLEMRIRLTTAVAHPLTKINQVCFPTTIDPDGWFVGDATITFTGVNSTDTVEIKRASDDATLYTFTGGGEHEFLAIDNFGVSAYLVRKSSTGTVLQTTEATPFDITVDNNGTFSLLSTALKAANGVPLSTFVFKNGVPQGWVPLANERVVLSVPGDVVQVYAHAYGYQPKLVTITGNTPSDYVLTMIPETFVDTTQANRDTIAAAFGNGLDGLGRFYLSVNADLRQYTPAEVLHALHWHILTQGALVGISAIMAGDLNGFALMRGGFVIRTAGFYGKVADSVTTTGNLGILVPLSIYVDPTVYAMFPGYTPVEKNTSGIVLQYAPWTQQEADIPAWVAKEDTVYGISLQTALIPGTL